MATDPVAAALEILEKPPTFRDYTGGDYYTCGYCHEPVERPDSGHRHAETCEWVRAIAHLSRLRPFSAGEPTEGCTFVTYTVEPDK